MTQQRVPVLIGDPNLTRRNLFLEILRNDFLTEPVGVDTFDELRAKYRQRDDWRIILVAEDLPFSRSEGWAILERWLLELSTPFLNPPLGYITAVGPRDFLSALRITASCIQVPPDLLGAPAAQAREAIIQALGSSLPRASPPPDAILDGGAELREQVRSLDNEGNLEAGTAILGRLVSEFFECRKVTVSRLAQGLSGSMVFKIRPELSNGPSEFALKVTRMENRRKVIREVRGRGLAAETLGNPTYRKHIPELMEARIAAPDPEPEFKFIGSHGGWYALCYDFLGDQPSGDFIDLAMALVASPAELSAKVGTTTLASHLTPDPDTFRGEVLGRILYWFCAEWYANPEHTSRDEASLWDTTDAPNDSDPTACPGTWCPPYRLRAKDKAAIIGFLEGPVGQVAEGLLPTDWDTCKNNVTRLVELHDGEPTGIAALDAAQSVILSPAHGDLNANNVFLWLDHPDQPFLIDFPFFQRHGHALQDLARLEVEILLSVMDRRRKGDGETVELPPAMDHTYTQMPLWTEMVQRLLAKAVPIKPWMPCSRKHAAHVMLCMNLIRRVREKAVIVQGKHAGWTGAIPEFRQEYLPALLLHLLEMIRHPLPSIFKRILAVYAAGKAIEILGGLGL